MKTTRIPRLLIAALTLIPFLSTPLASYADVELDNESPAVTAPAAKIASVPNTPAPPAPPASFNSDLYRVDKKLISSGQVGETAQYSLRIEAIRDLEQIRVLEMLPAGLEFIEAKPAPIKDSTGYIWTWENLPAKTVKEVIITVRQAKEGWLVTNTKTTALSGAALPLFAGTPKLELLKTGPASIELGETVQYKVTINNKGNAPATNVVLIDDLPSGLASPNSTEKRLTFNVGTINAGESKTIEIPLKATAQGKWENSASLTAAQLSAPLVAKAGSLDIVESKLALTKIGPQKKFVFTEAAYTIAVRNDGNTLLKNVVVTDEIPEGTKFVSASNNGQLKGNKVEWTVGDMQPKNTAGLQVTLLGLKPATTEGEALAQSGRFQAKAKAATLWEGAPGVLTEIVDDVDPIKVGEFTTYTVRITNQSPHNELTSDAVVELTSGLTAVEVSKEAKAVLEGQRIIVNGISLQPQKSFTFTIKVKATAAGIQHARLEFGTGFLPRPSVKEETTYVY